MTDQTVPVPVDLLKRLFDNTTLTRDVFDGDSVDVRPSGIGAFIDIQALIPVPPKAGDVLTDFGQIADLPDTTVIVDRDGDVYVVGNGAATRVTDRLSLSSEVRDRVDLGAFAFSGCGPITVHYVPDNA